MRLLENDRLQGGNSEFASYQATSYHPVIDYFPITALLLFFFVFYLKRKRSFLKFWLKKYATS